MRLVNDKQETNEVKTVDIFALISQMFLVSVGIATWVFSPMVMVLSHCRFTNPWSKVAGLGGAVLALLFLEVPLSQVVIGFVLGLFVADSLSRQVKPFQLLSQSLAVALVTALGCLFWASLTENIKVGEFWAKWVVELIEKLKTTHALEGTINWSLVKDLVLYEGPFLYLSAVLLSIWIAVGSAAHFGWIKEESNRYSASSLKGITIPRWLNLAFAVSFALTLFVTSDYQYLVGGLFRVLSGFMFVQGSVCLSILLAQRGVRHSVRTLIYCVAVLLGFYALVGMGVMSPWILRKRGRISPQILMNNLEEQT
jgi:hypothetical protein